MLFSFINKIINWKIVFLKKLDFKYEPDFLKKILALFFLKVKKFIVNVNVKFEKNQIYRYLLYFQ